MDSQEYFADTMHQRMSRRRMLGLGVSAVGSVAVLGLLAACGDDDDDEPAATTAPGQSTQAATSAATETATEGTADQSTATTGTSMGSTAPPMIGGRKDAIIGLFAEPAQLNEFYRTGITGGQVSHNIYDKLVRINYQTRQVDPELAESWDMEDELTWVLKLREGVMWHGDWGEFTADDVVFTFDYIMQEETFQIGTALFPVESTTKRDDYTVEVKLKQPFGAFLPITCDYGGVIMCKAAHEEMGFEAYGRAPIGTGAYMFDSWQSGSQIVTRKNPNYWGTEPILEEITWRFLPDAAVRLASLENGEIDYMDHPNAEDVPEIRDQGVPGITYTSVPGWNWDYMAFTFPPYSPEDAPWLKKEVRQAISYAIDRQTIIDEIYYGEALISDSPIPPGFLGHREGMLRYPERADLAKAQELMAQAGVSGFDLEVITSDKEWLRRELELVGAMLSQIGINITVQGLDIGTWTERWFGHQFQALLEDISIVAPDTDATLYWFHYPGTSSYHGWPNEEAHRLLDEARSSADQDAREDMYHQVVDLILEECPYIYFNHVNIVRLFNEKLGGMRISNQEYVLRMLEAHWTE